MAKQLKNTTDGFSEILLYSTPNGKVKVEILLQNETIWLTQQKIADLFGVQHGAIEGKTQESQVKYYNLDTHEVALAEKEFEKYCIALLESKTNINYWIIEK